MPDNEPATQPAFRFADFVIVFLGGLLGAMLGALSLLVSADQGVILVTTLAGQYAGHFLTAWLILVRRRARFEDVGMEVVPSDGIYILFGMGLQILVAILFAPLAMLFETEGSQQAITELVPLVEGASLQIVLVLAVGLLAPVVEELMFRGFLLKAIEQRRGPKRALVWSSLLFALFHLLGIGGGNPLIAAAIIIPQLFLVGLVLGRQVQRKGRLGPAIFTHAGFNLIAIIALLFFPSLDL